MEAAILTVGAAVFLEPSCKTKAETSITIDNIVFVLGSRGGAVDSDKMEYGLRTIYNAGFPPFPGVGVGGQSYSNFLASTVELAVKGKFRTILLKFPEVRITPFHALVIKVQVVAFRTHKTQILYNSTSTTQKPSSM